MKIKNFAMLAGVAGLLAACGGSSIVEPADLNDQRVFFAFNSSDISDEARDNLLGQSLYMKNHADTKMLVTATNVVLQNTTWHWAHVVQTQPKRFWSKTALNQNVFLPFLMVKNVHWSRAQANRSGSSTVTQQQPLNNSCLIA